MQTGPSAPALDEAVNAGRHLPGQWLTAGVIQLLNPVVVLIAVVLVVVGLGLPRDPDSGSVYTLVAGLVSGLVAWLSCRALARQYGGWGAAFGLDLPRPRDVPLVLGWLGIQFVARIVLVMVLAAVSPELAESHGGNTEGADALQPLGITMLLIGAVLVAPVVEELAFRGVVLRGLMRRMGFWPAALISSGLFAVLHAPGAAHLAAIPLLLTTIMLFAVLQCLLVRRTGRLAPAIGVHALMNLLVTVLAVTTG